MVDPVGLEPTTPDLKGRYSSQLSYGSINLVGVVRVELTLSRLRGECNKPLYDTPLADQVGIEPTTGRLTVASSTAELLVKNLFHQYFFIYSYVSSTHHY